MLKFLTLLIMLAGLAMTLAPRLPGALLILAAAACYGAFTGFAGGDMWLWAALTTLATVAEVGGRVLRIVLTGKYDVSREFSVNTTAGNLGGILAADAMLGPVAGLLVWELVAGKTLAPRWDAVLNVLIRLAAVSALRFICALIMIVLVMLYVL
jgi:uncharacterized protein YqgC (DUF456 family)